MIPAFAIHPLEPVTTTLARAESRMSCTFGSGGKNSFRMTNMRCNLAGSVPNNPSKSEKELIGHLRSQTGGVVHRCLPHHPPHGAPNQPQHLHRAECTLP